MVGTPLQHEECLPKLVEAGYVHTEEMIAGPMGRQSVVYLPEMYASEEAICEALNSINEGKDRLAVFGQLDWETAWRYLGSREVVHLTEQQRSAVKSALTSRIAVITGGPGTGKTTTLRAVIQALDSIKARYALASPTGRAARRRSRSQRPSGGRFEVTPFSFAYSSLRRSSTVPLA